MVARSTQSLRSVGVGDYVAVPVSPFDRSKGDPPNIIGVVVTVEESGYTIGTRNGIIKGKLARNQFEYVQYTGLQAEDIPPEQITLREIVHAQSVWRTGLS